MLKIYGDSQHHFVDPDPWVELFEKSWQQKKKALILKWGIEAPLHSCIGDWKTFHADSIKANQKISIMNG